jgi:hypothetical protein
VAEWARWGIKLTRSPVDQGEPWVNLTQGPSRLSRLRAASFKLTGAEWARGRNSVILADSTSQLVCSRWDERSDQTLAEPRL